MSGRVIEAHLGAGPVTDTDPLGAEAADPAGTGGADLPGAGAAAGPPRAGVADLPGGSAADGAGRRGTGRGWQRLCPVGDLAPDRGAAALVGADQVAVFLLADTGRVHAVAHRDPYSGANVMARGLVGSRGDRPTVASPMHKQVFDLVSGECLDDPAVRLDVWAARVVDGWVEVAR